MTSPLFAQSASYRTVLDRPVDEVWSVVRDFNDYPAWVDSVDESHIEDGLPGTTVGAIRNFSSHGVRTRQRLAAHSDVDHSFTYASTEPMELTDETVRTMTEYAGTVRLSRIDDGDRCLAEWTADYTCPADDAAYWEAWWADALPTWLASLRSHVEA